MNAWGGAVDDPTSEGEKEGERQLKAVLGNCTDLKTLRRVGISVRGICWNSGPLGPQAGITNIIIDR